MQCSALASVVAGLGCSLADGDDPAARVPLNSDMILARYGSYRVEVLHQDETLRLAALVSDSGSISTARTLALVAFERPLPAELAAADAAIRGGASLGSTLREFGFDVVKTHCHVGAIVLAEGHPAFSRLRLTRAEPVAVHSYDLVARDAAGARRYARITEMHHPDYLNERDVVTLYGAVHEPGCIDGFAETLAGLMQRDGH
ncbi:MAG: hypothetical protein AAFX58_14680 [Pseudomonadota bacterium]